jgi:PhnB protein
LKPEGWHTVTPRIIVSDAAGLIAFIKEVFDAVGDYHPHAPAELKIGDSIVMVSPAGIRERMNACLYVYVANADATYERAMSAGAFSMEAPLETPYGDRRGMVRDNWGNTWQIATRTRK